MTPLRTPSERAAALDSWLAGLATAGQFSGSVILAADGEPVLEASYGLADMDHSIAASSNTRFDVGSIGKAITRTAIAQLVSKGVVSLGDRVDIWLPDYPQVQSRAATIEQLLAHQGGIADIFSPAFRQADKTQLVANADFYRLVSEQPPLFAPGLETRYCNGCYVVLGEIVAAATGMSFERYVETEIFAPAGMAGALMRRPRDAAVHYGRPMRNGPLASVDDLHGEGGSGAGGWYATASDLLRFDTALRAHRLTPPGQTAFVLNDAMPVSKRSTAPAGFAGGAPGTSALLLGNGHWTLVVLANLDPPIATAIGEQALPEVAPTRPAQ